MTERVQHRVTRSPARDLAEQLLDLANRVARLGPNRRDPEKFHADKSDLVAELHRLAMDYATHAR
jgi:hypothetical protein